MRRRTMVNSTCENTKGQAACLPYELCALSSFNPPGDPNALRMALMELHDLDCCLQDEADPCKIAEETGPGGGTQQ